MTALAKIVRTETKLYLREPLSAFFGVLFPAVLILVLGSAIHGFQDPSEDIGGRRPVDLYLPITLALAIGTVAMVTLLGVLSAYREKGVLRRLSTTPVSPVSLLLGQLAVNLGALVVASALAVVGAYAAFRAQMPGNVIGAIVAFVLGATAMCSVALLIAAVTPTTRASAAVGSIVYYPMLFAAGVWTPGPLMPDAVRLVSDYTPLGAASYALQDAWAGHWPQPLHLIVVAGLTLVLGGIAARRFRWE